MARGGGWRVLWLGDGFDGALGMGGGLMSRYGGGSWCWIRRVVRLVLVLVFFGRVR